MDHMQPACDTVTVLTDSPDRLLPQYQSVGSFRYLASEDRWEWSDAVARMHGYPPGTVTPTTELILSHKHPEDKPSVAEIIEQVRRHQAAFSSRHRIIDTGGRVHVVVVVGDALCDDAGRVIGTSGFYVDVTQAFEADAQQSVSEAISAIEENRAVINQAMGVLMIAYSVSAERAFDVLKWRSQQTNTKLRDIAANFLANLGDIRLSPETCTAIDHALLTS
jgi:PAS domain S-box-containing protein